MTQSYDTLGDRHLPLRERDDYQDRRTPGWKQLLCAWFILLAVAALFKFSDIISANRPAPFAHATNLTQLADDIDRWERGEPRQRTMTVPNADEFVLVSSVDK
jgi:hypothetical protein